jgi:hypothetical protein
LKDAQAQLGHSKLSTTLEIYTVPIPAHLRARTADLRPVHCVVRRLNPFACLAFPVLTRSKMRLNYRVLVTNW